MTAAQLPSVCRLSWRPRTLRHLLGGDSFFSESLETQWSRHPTGHLYCQRPTWARDLRLAVWLLPPGGGAGPAGGAHWAFCFTSTGHRWRWGDGRHSVPVRKESLEGWPCAHPTGGPPTHRMTQESDPMWGRGTPGKLPLSTTPGAMTGYPSTPS